MKDRRGFIKRASGAALFGHATGIQSAINPTVCEEGHVYVCHFTNGLVTLTQGANLRLASSTSFTPSSNGATLTFRIEGNVAYEIGRTAY